jgi:DNA-binding XRE family transcriptional regulator
MITTEKKQQAQFLYMAQGKTQKEIADLVGVSERTIYAWIHQYAWDKLRLAAYQAPATIADNLCSQLVELQNTIAAREPGNRFPTPQEAEVSRKLITCLEKMKKSPGMGQSMQVLETFRNYIRPINNELARDLGRYAGQFLEAASVNGYAPYQVEYGVAPISTHCTLQL